MKFIVVLLLLLCKDAAGGKKWLRNTNFENNGNWRRMKLPCKTDRIIFPQSAPVISVLKNVYFSDAMLPINGEFVLGPDISLFSVPPHRMHSSSCPGTDAKYVRSKPLSWFDPSNWCKYREENNCVQSPVHASMFPSQYDQVIFPNPMDSHYVDIDYHDSVVIQGLNYRNKWQTTHDFRVYVSSFEGRKEFVNTKDHFVPTITMTKKACTDVKGCIPNTLNEKLFRKICSKVTCKQTCKTPIKVNGSCCNWCGSQILVKIGDAFAFNSFESQIVSTLSQWTSLKFDVLKISAEKVQIALSDTNGGKEFSKGVTAVAKLLMSRKKQLGIDSFTLKSSSGPMKNYEYQAAAKKNVPVILGVLFGLLILVIVIVIGYEINRRVRNGHLTLPQIQNIFTRTTSRNFFHFSWSSRTDSEELSSPGLVNMELTATSTSFHNPVYRSSEIHVTPFDDSYDDPMATTLQESLTNPVYRPSSDRKEHGAVATKTEEKIDIGSTGGKSSEEVDCSEA